MVSPIVEICMKPASTVHSMDRVSGEIIDAFPVPPIESWYEIQVPSDLLLVLLLRFVMRSLSPTLYAALRVSSDMHESMNAK